jgi:hypothetical protein
LFVGSVDFLNKTIHSDGVGSFNWKAKSSAPNLSGHSTEGS